MIKVFKNIFKVFFVFIFGCILITIINFVLNKFVFVTRYQINNKNIPNNFNNYKIIQLTDIHSIRNAKQKEKIINKIKTEEPDIIFVTGDLIDAEYYTNENNQYKEEIIDFPDKLTFEFITELIDISNVYWIYGNHEMMLLDNPDENVFKVALEEAGAKLLNNKIDIISIKDESIKLVGIQDPATLYKDKKYAFVGENNYDKTEQILEDLFYSNSVDTNLIDEKIKDEYLSDKEGLFTILLSHRPEYFKLYEKYPIDLALTGHTHGGVVKLPLIGGLYAHPQGWFPDYTSGMYKTENFQMIVGRGIGYSQVPIRVFNPPEIISIILKNN